MKTAILVVLFVTFSIAATCAVETQVNTVLSFSTAKISGNVIHRQIEFADLAENEVMLGRPVSSRLTVFGTYTEDSNDNRRIGVALSHSVPVKDWRLNSNLFLWHGLDGAEDRIKLGVYFTRTIGKNVSFGAYYLYNKAANNAPYVEGGPVVTFKAGSFSANGYFLKKNNGNYGLQSDFCYSF